MPTLTHNDSNYNNNIDTCSIYTPPNSDTAPMHLQQWLMSNPTPANSSALWVGDFNKHNPLWSGPNQVCRCRYSTTELLMQLLTK